MVVKNFPLAAKLYELAAHAEIPMAQYRLGVFYLEDIGGTRDVVRAFAWFARAAANERGGGLKAHAAKARDKVAQHLNDKDKARGAALLKQKSTQPKATPSKPKKQSTGTGFIVSADGYILTNNHVVAGYREVRIEPLKVPVVAEDSKGDLALLKVSANFKRFATFRDGAVRKGEGVVVSKLDALKMARTTGDIPQNVNLAIKGSIARDFMAKHGVTAVIAPSTTDLPAADVAERAQFYTALIECWK